MRTKGLVLLLSLITFYSGSGQVGETTDPGILFNGIVRDATTLLPLTGAQIAINGSYRSVSDEEGTFSFRVRTNDTVLFSLLGYKSALFHISDTLSGKEFAAGVFMTTDTISIETVIIIPRLSVIVSDIMKAPVSSTPEMENARYNIAVSAYAGKISQGRLGDPASNYNILHQKQRIDAFEKGTIPSDRIVGLSPLMILPAAYLLLNGLPPGPTPMKTPLTKQEIDRISELYLESKKK